MKDKIQTAVTLDKTTKSDVEAIALVWEYSQQDILKRAIAEFLVNNIDDVRKGRSLLAEIEKTRKEIG